MVEGADDSETLCKKCQISKTKTSISSSIYSYIVDASAASTATISVIANIQDKEINNLLFDIKDFKKSLSGKKSEREKIEHLEKRVYDISTYQAQMSGMIDVLLKFQNKAKDTIVNVYQTPQQSQNQTINLVRYQEILKLAHEIEDEIENNQTEYDEELIPNFKEILKEIKNQAITDSWKELKLKINNLVKSENIIKINLKNLDFV